MSLDKLNADAQRRFEKIRAEKWTVEKIKQLAGIDKDKVKVMVDSEKLQQMLDAPIEQEVKKENVFPITTGDTTRVTGNVMEFIDSLNLKPRLSIALAYLITYNKDGNKDGLNRVLELIQEEIKDGN